MPTTCGYLVGAGLFFVCLCVCDAGRQRNEGTSPPGCGQWQMGACENLKKNGGTCGRGTQKGRRTGDATVCAPLERSFPCNVPCRDENKKGCRYRKGKWGACDAATSKRIRTDPLIRQHSDSTCAPTRPFEKPCEKKKCEYGPWGQFGACESGVQIRTRPILTGTEAECGSKAKKTKQCRNGGGRTRGNRNGSNRH